MNEAGLQYAHQKADAIISKALNENANVQEFNSLLFIAGGWKVAKSVADSLNAALIISLQEVRDSERYLAAGFSRFDEFLDNWQYSPMGYRKFNDNENILKKLGSPLAFDLVRNSGIPLAKQRLISRGEVWIEDDKMMVKNGEELVALEISNKPGWTDALVALADAKAEERSLRLATEAKLKNKDAQIEAGTRELEKQQRYIDSLTETPRFQRALMHAVNAQLLLIEAVGELDDSEKAARGRDDLKLFATQYFNLSDAYGVKRSLAAPADGAAGTALIDRAIQGMIEDGSLDDLD